MALRSFGLLWLSQFEDAELSPGLQRAYLRTDILKSP